MKKNRLGSFIVFLFVSFLSSGGLVAQSTAFHYQGSLQVDGSPADGMYDLSFSLHALESGGTPLASITNANVAVANSLFQVDLDFGAEVFDGANYWLEVGVANAGSGGPFTILNPRQSLNTVPYAIQALRASAVPDSGLSGNVVRLDGQPVFQDSVGIATAAGDVQIIAGDDAPELIVSGGTIDGTLRLRNALQIWPSTSGATGGTFDVRDATGDPRVALPSAGDAYFDGGRVGIGTRSPAGMLDVQGEIIIGNSTAGSPVAGSIRWTGTQFEGFDGSQWVPFALTAEPPVIPLTNMVLIPAGSFLMGSFPDEVDRETDEGPVTSTSISRSIWMGIYEVTQGEYARVMGTNPSAFTGDTQRPVEMVSWNAAVAYCAALTAEQRSQGRISDRYEYRLPTEAEWEYANRAGTTTRFYYGDDLTYTNLTRYAWYTANSEGSTHPVGQKRPNAWGLYDMSGNVWEWCQDLYESSYHGGGVADPQGGTEGVNRILRGGSWSTLDRICRAARRFRFAPDLAINDFGFRVVLAEVIP